MAGEQEYEERDPYDDPAYRKRIADQERDFKRGLAREAEEVLGYNPYAEEGYCQKCGRSCGGNLCERCSELARGIL